MRQHLESESITWGLWSCLVAQKLCRKLSHLEISTEWQWQLQWKREEMFLSLLECKACWALAVWEENSICNLTVLWVVRAYSLTSVRVVVAWLLSLFSLFEQRTLNPPFNTPSERKLNLQSLGCSADLQTLISP